jgi:HemY protein
VAQLDPPAAPVIDEKPPVVASPASPEPVAQPAESKSATVVANVPPPVPVPVPDPAPKPVVIPTPASEAKPAAAKQTASAPLKASRPVAFPLEHAPDDPGPGSTTHEDSTTDSRYRLFN